MVNTTNLFETGSVSLSVLRGDIMAEQICNKILCWVREIIEDNSKVINKANIIGEIHDKNLEFMEYELLPLVTRLGGKVSNSDISVSDINHNRWWHEIDRKDPMAVFIENFFTTSEIDGLYSDPASSKFHGNFIGGLFCHSLMVYFNCLTSAHLYGLDPLDVSFIACMCHDLTKVGKYNIYNDETGKTIIAYAKNELSYSNSIQHGPESVRRILNNWYLICDHMKTFYSDEFNVFKNKKDGLGNRWMLPEGEFRNSLYSVEWEQAVAYHMGMYDVSEVDSKAFSAICENNPYVLMLHNADMLASKIYNL